MSETEQITVSLPRDVVERLRAAVAAGAYASVSEALARAAIIWDAEQRMPEMDDATLKRLFDEGMVSGEPVEITIAEIKARALRRLEDADRAS
jgi:antitoxin ParD1/3/4